jgi:hypothetical protein
MRSAWLSFLLLTILSVSVALAGDVRYKLEYFPMRDVDFTVENVMENPTGKSKEWFYYSLQPDVTPRQKITMTLEPDGQPGFSDAPDRKPLQFVRKIYDQPLNNLAGTVRVRYIGTLNETRLTPLKDGEKAPEVKPLTAEQRSHYTQATSAIDFDDGGFQQWLDKKSCAAGVVRANWISPGGLSWLCVTSSPMIGIPKPSKPQRLFATGIPFVQASATPLQPSCAQTESPPGL